MNTEGSITRFIHGLRSGEKDAASEIWHRFFDRMKGLARLQISPSVAQGSYDEEDVALSAFAIFCRSLQHGSYPDLRCRLELWQILATFTIRKAREKAAAAQTLKRGGLANSKSNEVLSIQVDELAGQSLPPDLIATMNEQSTHLFGLLNDPDLEKVGAWKLEGYTNEEIAEQLGCTAAPSSACSPSSAGPGKRASKTNPLDDFAKVKKKPSHFSHLSSCTDC